LNELRARTAAAQGRNAHVGSFQLGGEGAELFRTETGDYTRSEASIEFFADLAYKHRYGHSFRDDHGVYYTVEADAPSN
jgi:hypothetical protein